ncbi:MAG: DNA polymerase I, partial [Candidatus Omnitrophica bacterium]|nr:DNA polymerase I [Candidatus Omnitrophota bacterium]
MKKERLFLIDGNSYCYRAYYAIKDLKNSKGQPTNAVYGFILMLKKLLASEKPDYMGIAFDLKGPTFRHKRFNAYKIKRKPMPDDLVSQMPLIKEVVAAYNIAIFEKEGFEADDILATVARKIAKEGVEVYIVTGDKDALQLVDDNIKVCSTHKEGLVYDKEAVMNRFSGLGPENMTDLMALSGDVSDNIPGVRGVGEKTAIELIKDFKDIDTLYKNIDKIKNESKRKMLAEQEDIARLSKELATVDDSVPIEVELSAVRLKDPDRERLVRIFKDLDFKALAKEAAPDSPGLRSGACYKAIVDIKGFEGFLSELKKQKEFVFDFETTSENPLVAVPVGVSFCWETGKAYYVALASKAQGFPRLGSASPVRLTSFAQGCPEHSQRTLTISRSGQAGPDCGVRQGVDPGYVFKALKGIMENENIKKIGQNIKYEKLILSNCGIGLNAIEFDTMIASYLLNPSKFNHNLDDLAFERLDHKMI